MAKQYSEDQLKSLGKQCGNRVPPASVMIAMLLYEMQRDTDPESLFKEQALLLTKAKQHFGSHDHHISDLSEQVETLRQEVAANDTGLHVSMSKVRMDAFQLKLGDLTLGVKNQGERMVSLEEQTRVAIAFQLKLSDIPSGMENQRKRIVGLEEKVSDIAVSTKDLCQEMNEKWPDIAAKLTTQLASLACVQSELGALNADIAILFEERDAIANLMDETKVRMDHLEKQHRSKTDELKHELCELAVKVEKQANESNVKAEQHALEQSKEAKQASHEYIAKVEHRLFALINKANERLVKVEEDADDQLASAGKETQSQLARVEQVTNMAIDLVDKKVNDRLEKTERQLKEQISLADQKANLIIGEVGKYRWMADIEKKGLEDITNSVNRMRVKFEDQLWDSTKDLQTQMQAQAEAQNERISRLEDLVRALTGQSENSSPTYSQLLYVQAANGKSYDLSVPKGQPFVPYKAEHVRSFVPGKRWMA